MKFAPKVFSKMYWKEVRARSTASAPRSTAMDRDGRLTVGSSARRLG